MASHSERRYSDPLTSFDAVLIGWYVLFGVVALSFEPAYYFGCEWSGLLCPAAAKSPVMRGIRDLWMIYAHWDPLFLEVPLWLRVLCSIEVFVFGPLYLITAWGILRRASWLKALALPFSGALVYSTGVYFTMELLEAMPGTNMLMVFAVNLPWTIVPLMLMWRCCADGKATDPRDDDNRSIGSVHEKSM
jgi:hypothetical protein